MHKHNKVASGYHYYKMLMYNLRQIQKLWIFYLFVMFFGTFVFLFASYLLVDQSTYFQNSARYLLNFNLFIKQFIFYYIIF